jgi:uncharacterized protein YlaI
MHNRDETPDIVKTEDISKLLKNLNPISLFECPECSVCLSQLDGDMYVLKCGHFYHKACILEHLKMKLECPTCRLKLPNDQPYVIIKQYLKQADVKDLLQTELKGRMNFALAKSMYNNLKYVCGVC